MARAVGLYEGGGGGEDGSAAEDGGGRAAADDREVMTVIPCMRRGGSASGRSFLESLRCDGVHSVEREMKFLGNRMFGRRLL